jgi:thioredoxin 1
MKAARNFGSASIILTNSTLSPMDYQQAKKLPGTVLVEFYASWCPHCQRMKPIVARVKEQLKGQTPVYQYDVDKYPEAANKANVESYPTFIVYRDGKEQWRFAGEIAYDDLMFHASYD